MLEVDNICTMRITALIIIIIGLPFSIGWAVVGRAQVTEETIEISGVTQTVEIITDIWGIAHIYAQNQGDLFFAQGFNVARDRLFQLEIWRRQATGTMAEIIGERALVNDRGARLFAFRGDLKEELNHYHADGEDIIRSFVSGINAYIDLAGKEPELLPLEFSLLGMAPQHWTPEVVVSRHNGLYRNVSSELSLARNVAALGAERVKGLENFHPGDPELKLAPGIDVDRMPDAILDLYRARSAAPQFGPEHIIDPARRRKAAAPRSRGDMLPGGEEEGSNNWVVNGSMSFAGYPIMANDPHRSQQIPSLRYLAHLVAPGWNVIGGGEPALPGESIGHNEYGAWGLTIFSTDQEDLYVYDTNPDNPHQYRYRDNWEEMTVLKESVPVKGRGPVAVELTYTRHGPVVYEDRTGNKAYALRAAWLEVGAAPYLASLRMDQAKSWEEFREACSYSRTPSENMVWCDADGNIGWQVVGMAPVRENWYGLLPVPGDGRYEWQGFVPILELPHLHNPPQGYIATANEDNIPHGYPYRLGYSWTEPFRINRIKEVLESGVKFTIADMMKLQHDELSLPARTIVPLLRKIEVEGELARSAHQKMLCWDCAMAAYSVEATIYYYFETLLRSAVRSLSRQHYGVEAVPVPSLSELIALLHAPDARFGPDPVAGRNAVLTQSFEGAVGMLSEELGSDMSEWRYGQEKVHYIRMGHMLSSAVDEGIRARLDLGPLPRGGSGTTVNNTGSGNQRSGASLRIIADTGNWDNSAGTNNPGQSGDPDSRHYSDLFKMWAEGDYFPLLFSRSRIEAAAERITVLIPKRG